MKQYDGKWAVITGGSDGIGFGIAKAFATEGANLVIIGKEHDGVQKAAASLREYGVHVEAMCADFSDPVAIQSISEEVLESTKQVDILVNNVGLIRFTPFDAVAEQEFDAFININIKTAYFITQGLLSALTSSRGNVINLTSYFASKMLPGRPSTAYSMTKGAIISLTKALAYELGPRGIRVNAISPGTVDTPGRTAEIAKMSSEGQRRLAEFNRNSYPAGRIGKPDDVASVAVFLASEAAEWVTGSVFVVDGGLTTN